MVFGHRGDYASQYEAIRWIAGKIGRSGETLRNWVRQAECDNGLRAGPTTDESERIKALETRGAGASPSQRNPEEGLR